MKKPPRPDRRAKTGSNIRSRKARAARVAVFAARHTLETNRALRVRFRKLFSKADLRAAREIIARTRHELDVANLKSGPDATAWDANRLRFRQSLARELGRKLAGYREWQTVLREAQRARDRAEANNIALIMPGTDIHIDTNDLPIDRGVLQVFTPPFAVHEAFARLTLDTSLDYEDRSFTVPSIGHIINDIDYTFSDDGTFEEALGIDVRARMLAWAGCGIDLHVPADGHLKLTARLGNFYNSVWMTIRDQVGFSGSSLKVKVMLYLDILTASGYEPCEVLLLQKHLSSGGGEQSYQMPLLSTGDDYVVETTSVQVYRTNQHVQILAGCRILIDSTIDDMTTHARPLLWWELKEMTLEVIPHIIF